MGADSSFAVPRRSDDRFFGGMALVIAALVFAGFSRTFFLSRHFHGPALSPLRVVHGTAFTAWIVLFAAQTALVASDRTQLHRALGVAGAALACVMVGLGVILAIAAAREGHAPPHVDPRAFLAVPLFDMLVFPTFVGAALHFRHRPDAHKRLMLLATLGLLGAAAARLPTRLVAHGPVFYFGVVDLLVIAAMLRDLIERRQVHPAFVWGALFLVASQIFRLWLGGTHAWLAFAGMITGR